MEALMALKGHGFLPREIAAMCRVEGWRDDNLVTAVAICLAESEGYQEAEHVNDDATSTLPASIDRGLFQINSRSHPDVSEACAFDAGCNVDGARAIFVHAGNSFRPWAAYTSGRALDPA